jgi:hypothetical protein
MLQNRERRIPICIDLAGDISDISDVMHHARQGITGYRDRHDRDSVALTGGRYLPDPVTIESPGHRRSGQQRRYGDYKPRKLSHELLPQILPAFLYL